jgi:predicted GNAT family acetyltransferase
MVENQQVIDNQAESRYEIEVDGRTARLNYRRYQTVIDLIHTGVPPDLEGRGIGSLLAKFALEDARQQNLKVIPSCPFVRAYLKRHPEYQDLVYQREA